MTARTDHERAEFEKWLGIKPCGAAHDFGWAAWQARAALAAPAPMLVEQPSDKELLDVLGDELDSSDEVFIRFGRAVLAQFGHPAKDVNWDAELGLTAMRFVDRAGDVHPGIDDAETICADFYSAMISVIDRMPHVQRMKTDAAMHKSAAAPVLPEPFAYVEHHKAGDNLWFDCPGGKYSGLYTEQQVRALLATASAETEPFGYFKAEPFGWTDCGPDDEGAVALYEKPQAMLATGGQAQAVEQAPVLYVSKGQLDNHRDPDGPDSANAGRYLPARITPAGNFTMPLFAAPQAQAEHIKALIEVSRMPNQEHVADAHNAAVRHLRAIAAAKEQE